MTDNQNNGQDKRQDSGNLSQDRQSTAVIDQENQDKKRNKDNRGNSGGNKDRNNDSGRQDGSR